MKNEKGIMYMEIFTAMIIVLIVVMILFAYWNKTKEGVGESAPSALNGLLGGLVLTDLARRKKGIVLTTTMLATIVFVIIVAMVLIFLYMSLQAEAGSSAGGFFYNMFDSIMKGVPSLG